MNTEQRDTHFDLADEMEALAYEQRDKATSQIPERNAAGIAYPSIEEQEEFWEQRDIGGNTTPDRVQANEDRYGD